MTEGFRFLSSRFCLQRGQRKIPDRQQQRRESTPLQFRATGGSPASSIFTPPTFTFVPPSLFLLGAEFHAAVATAFWFHSEFDPHQVRAAM